MEIWSVQLIFNNNTPKKGNLCLSSFSKFDKMLITAQKGIRIILSFPSSPASLSHLPSKITTLKLANNSFSYIPDTILDLPK